MYTFGSRRCTLLYVTEMYSLVLVRALARCDAVIVMQEGTTSGERDVTTPTRCRESEDQHCPPDAQTAKRSRTGSSLHTWTAEPLPGIGTQALWSAAPLYPPIVGQLLSVECKYGRPPHLRRATPGSRDHAASDENQEGMRQKMDQVADIVSGIANRIRSAGEHSPRSCQDTYARDATKYALDDLYCIARALCHTNCALEFAAVGAIPPVLTLLTVQV